ncbi:MAG: hypothetical protein ACI9MC_000379 [Kiritimatiellia bacterium]|jgi:hypothetical protein
MIHVHFFDSKNRAPLGSTSVDADSLPTDFDGQTTINVGDRPYQVISAHPTTRAEAVESGELRILVRPLAVVDPSEILYSLPTICHHLPGIEAGSSKTDQRVLEINEDTWRQIELVPTAHAAWAGEQLRAIQAIYKDHRSDNGAFRQLHVREDTSGEWFVEDDVAGWLDDRLESLDGLGFVGVVGCVDDGLVWELCEGWTVYVAPALHGGVHVGVHGQGEVDSAAVSVLMALLKRFDAALVRWDWLALADGSDQDRLLHVLGAR